MTYFIPRENAKDDEKTSVESVFDACQRGVEEVDLGKDGCILKLSYKKYSLAFFVTGGVEEVDIGKGSVCPFCALCA